MIWYPVEATRIEDAWLCLIWGLKSRDIFYVRPLAIADAEVC